MSSAVSLLSLSSHHSKDFLLHFATHNNRNDKDMASFPRQVMVGNECNKTNGSGPDTLLPGGDCLAASNRSCNNTKNSQESAAGSAISIDTNVSSTASASGTVHRTQASASLEPPSKRIKREERVHTSPPPAAVSTIPAATNVRKSFQRSDVAPATITAATSTSQPKQQAQAQASGIPSSGQVQQATKAQAVNEGSSVVTAPTDASHQTCQSSDASLQTAPGTSSSSTSAGTPPTNSPSSSSSSSTAAITTTGPAPILPPGAPKDPPAAAAPAVALPLKSITFAHLSTKYLAELEYMLREFRKLERQLLGAKGAAQLEESAGSRERREKLHSFILHLEDTVRQIEDGCKLENEGKSATNDVAMSGAADEAGKRHLAEQSALSSLTKEKEEEENVQKLEEHILANLLPVKVRLKKQLAAQQGATQNPAGMPARRGSLQPPAAVRGKGTFAEAAENRRKQAEAARLAAQEQQERTARRVSDATQFGKPLGGGGSSLTRNLHGATLGSSQRAHGHGVGAAPKPEERNDGSINGERKVLYAGMVPGSSQQKSGLSAAAGVHDMVTSNQKDDNEEGIASATEQSEPTAAAPARTKTAVSVEAKPHATAPVQSAAAASRLQAKPSANQKKIQDHRDPSLSEEERRSLRKKRRKRKLLRLARRQERERLKQQNQSVQQGAGTQATAKTVTNVRKKAALGKSQKKKGPRSVEYICALCSEVYTSTCDYNPWWALAQHDCPKCRKAQIPRIDISSPANAIEYHPALLAHVEDNSGSNNNNPTSSNNNQPASPSLLPGTNSDVVNTVIDSDSDTDLSELSDDDGSMGSVNSEDSESDFRCMTPAEQAEHETFGSDYAGPTLSDEHASRLLILMSHAATCPCHHISSQHQEVCISTKYMMLHVRDCPGTTSTLDVCPFPWCRKVKHLLYHLVSCIDPANCPICSPKDIPRNFKDLMGLNNHRIKKHRQSMVAAAKAALNSTRSRSTQAKPPPTSASVGSSKPPAARKAVSGAPARAVGASATKEASERIAMNEEPSSGSSATRRLPKSTTAHALSHESDQVPDPITAMTEPTALVKSESTPDLDSDVLPTPIAAMKMEEDDEHDVSELLEVTADPIYEGQKTQERSNSTSHAAAVAVLEAEVTSSESASYELPPPVPVKTEEYDTAEAVTTAHATATTSSSPSISEPSSSTTSPDVEKTAGPVKVN